MQMISINIINEEGIISRGNKLKIKFLLAQSQMWTPLENFILET